MIDIAVIGGGPAGLVAGLYAARGGARTVIFERQAAGGQIITTAWVENYPAFPEGVSGVDLGERMAAQATEQGAEMALFSEVTSLTRVEAGDDLLPALACAKSAASDVPPVAEAAQAAGEAPVAPRGGGFLLQTTDAPVFARAVILATGAVPRKLGIVGEAAYTGRGVSWCATCDGAFYRDKVVAVIGGGDAALEEALFLTKFASRVFLVHRRHEFRAAQAIVEKLAQSDKVEPVLGFIPLEILGGEDGKVCGLRLEQVEDGAERVLDVAGVFEFVGTDPIAELVAGGLIDTDARGYVRTDALGATDLAGLFAAGDVTDGQLKQVVTAAGAGANAAYAALHYLEGR